MFYLCYEVSIYIVNGELFFDVILIILFFEQCIDVVIWFVSCKINLDDVVILDMLKLDVDGVIMCLMLQIGINEKIYWEFLKVCCEWLEWNMCSILELVMCYKKEFKKSCVNQNMFVLFIVDVEIQFVF